MFIKILISFLLGVIVQIDGAPISNANPWNAQNVTYSITDNHLNLSLVDVRNIVSKAFNAWSAVIPLNFTEVDPSFPANIQIIFASSKDNPIFRDRSGFVIPYEKIYVFGDSPRVINIVGQTVDPNVTDFYYETLYNVGKVLGLNNSRNKSSMMYNGYIAPVDFNGNYVEPVLSMDDIRAAQRIYGQRNNFY